MLWKLFKKKLMSKSAQRREILETVHGSVVTVSVISRRGSSWALTSAAWQYVTFPTLPQTPLKASCACSMWLHFRLNFWEECGTKQTTEGFLSVHEVQHKTVGHTTTLAVPLVEVTSGPRTSFFSAVLSLPIFSRKGHSTLECECQMSKSGCGNKE